MKPREPGQRPRYLPDRPLPAYAYLPGRGPHPRRHPEGHAYGSAEPTATPIRPAQWRTSEAWLRGVDLLNHGYPWEAHESWEALWNAARNRGDDVQADFVQGLIQCAAAVVKARVGNDTGVDRLTAKGLARLSRVADRHGRFMGMDVREFVADFASWASDPRSEPPILRLSDEAMDEDRPGQ